MPPSAPGQDLEPRQAAHPDRKPSVDMSRPITDLDEAWRVATMLANANALPRALQGNPANIILIMMTGQELGMTANQAIRLVYVPSSGVPQLRGEALLVRLRQKGHSYNQPVYTDDGNKCTFTLTRGDDHQVFTGDFSLDDALTAGLVTRDNDGELVALSQLGKPMPWQQYRRDMLFWRAVARAVRIGAPEITYGFDIAGADGAFDDAPPVTLQPETPERTAARESAEPAVSSSVEAELAELNEQGEAAAAPRPAAAADSPAAALMSAFSRAGIRVSDDPGRVNELLSLFTNRHVTDPGQLEPDEHARLAGILDSLAAGPEPLINLTQRAGQWAAQWAEHDPDGYAAWDAARSSR